MSSAPFCYSNGENVPSDDSESPLPQKGSNGSSTLTHVSLSVQTEVSTSELAMGEGTP